MRIFIFKFPNQFPQQTNEGLFTFEVRRVRMLNIIDTWPTHVMLRCWFLKWKNEKQNNIRQ